LSDWVGEIVECSDISTINVEVYPQLQYTEDLALLQAEIDQNLCILPVLHMMKVPLDPTRKAVALNMDQSEINRQYPQQALFIKQYFHCFLAGSLQSGVFREAFSPPGLGIHSRLKPLELKYYQQLLSHEASLYTFLSCFTRDPSYIPSLKTIGRNFMRNQENQAYKSVFLKNLSLLLKGQYFILKDLSSYIFS